MVKVILFDFWGTLVENGVWSPIKQVRNTLGIQLPFPEYVVRMERAMMTSMFESLPAAFQAVCREFQVEPRQEIMDELVGLWNTNWMLAAPYPETLDVLNNLREKYTLVLVSNTDCFSIGKVLEKFGLKELFHRLFFSYELQMIKTERNFLKTIVDELGVDVEDCVMVGDSLQSDILTAQKLGMKAILVDRKNSRDSEPKIATLSELGKHL